MTLPASGAISLNQVNTELGLSATATISMGSTNVRTLFGVTSGAISMSNGWGKSNLVPGQALFTTPGVNYFTVPTGCTRICIALAAGGGGAGGSEFWYYGTNGGAGGGGGAAYLNDIAVTPGQVITMDIGYGGPRGTSGQYPTDGDPGQRTVIGAYNLWTYRGEGGIAGSSTHGASGIGGGAGPAGTNYVGNDGGAHNYNSGAPGGTTSIPSTCYLGTAGKGGNSGYSNTHQPGNAGAVRIMWGANRAYPSTNTADQ